MFGTEYPFPLEYIFRTKISNILFCLDGIYQVSYIAVLKQFFYVQINNKMSKRTKFFANNLLFLSLSF